jgi:phenylalanyl-tRNA synthetase beta chain
VEFFHLKGLLENALEAAGVAVRFGHPAGDPWLHPVESGAIHAALARTPAGAGVVFGREAPSGEARIGAYGVLHPRVAAAFDLKGPVLAAEISLSGLLAAARAPAKFKAFGHFSAVTRDANLLVDEAKAHGEILARIPQGRIPNLAEVRLNSVYRGTGVPEGKKALHYTFTYRNPERTLTDEEVNKAQEKVNRELAQDAGIAFK